MLNNKFLIFSLYFCLLLGIGLTGHAQMAPSSYVVFFKDKDTVSYSCSRPQAFLSDRAIAKRSRFQLPITYMDLPVCAAYLDTLSKLVDGVRLLTSSRWFNYAVIGTDDSAGICDAILERIGAFRWVSAVYPIHAVPDMLYAAFFEKVIVDEAVPHKRTEPFSEQIDSIPAEYWGESFRQIAALNGHFLHQKGYLGEKMLIAVIDDGFKLVDSLGHFSYLREQGKLFGMVDMVDNKVNLCRDAGSHGMKVLSLMAINVPYDYVGSAPEADYLLIRTEVDSYEDLLEEYFWVAGAEYADSAGADVINSSLGYSTYERLEQNHTWAHLDGKHSFASLAAERLTRTCVVNIAAGNEGTKIWHLFDIPSDAPSVLCVAAMSVDSSIANFSSRGSMLYLKPDITSVGFQAAYCSTNDTIYYGNGTSFATPLNCGLTACLWQAFPEKTAKQVMTAIRESAHFYPNFDTAFGYGVPDYEKAYLLLKGVYASPLYALENRVHLYPNPASRFCWVESEGGEAELYNALGQSCLQTNLTSGRTQLFFGDLPEGIYFLHIRQGGCRCVKKVHVVHAR